MTLEENNTVLHQKYFVADLGSDITRHFEIVFVELVDHAILYCNTGGFGGFVCIREAIIASTLYFELQGRELA